MPDFNNRKETNSTYSELNISVLKQSNIFRGCSKRCSPKHMVREKSLLTYLSLRDAVVLVAFSICAATSKATDVFSIVTSGENAPESLVRIISTKIIDADRVAVVAMQGPCKREARIRADFLIQTKQRIAKGDLFFKVPAPAGQDGFSLRRATSDEAGKYEQCHWQ